jgi:hypothetical protein
MLGNPVRTLIAGAFLCGTGHLAYASGTALRGHVDTKVEFAVAAQFQRAFDAGGMTEVASELNDCYNKLDGATQDSDTQATMCMLFDQFAYTTELGFRQHMEGNGAPVTPAAWPILTDKAFAARQNIYAELYFAGSASALSVNRRGIRTPLWG